MIVIPARMGSTRYPGKPLADLYGKPMVQWVCEAARDAKVTDRIAVATPDDEIVSAVEALGFQAIRTSLDHQTGTDRIAEVAEKHPAPFYINVQGDEPLMRASTIRACAEPMLSDPETPMATVCDDCAEEDMDDPNVVKAVRDRQGFALYFSRSAIPHARNLRVEKPLRHIGIYAYRAEALRSFAGWSQTPLEIAESLEQLRFLENGVRIAIAKGEAPELAVDTPEQADRVRALLSQRQQNL